MLRFQTAMFCFFLCSAPSLSGCIDNPRPSPSANEPAPGGDAGRESRLADRRAESPSATGRRSEPADPVQWPAQSAADEPPIDPWPPLDDPTLNRIAFRHLGGETYYLVIENQIRESGGVPPLLSYSTAIKERRTLMNRVLPDTLRQATREGGSTAHLATILWQCERYEVTEEGMADRAEFDSLRHSYPVSTLWELGKIPRSRCTFVVDRRTGKASEIMLQPHAIAGAADRKNLSKIAQKLALTEENIARLYADLGVYWMPDRPVREGDTWTVVHVEEHKTFGTVTNRVQGALRAVRTEGDRKVAYIDITGDYELKPPPAPATQPAASRPTRTRRPPREKREFSIDKSVCRGNVRFDLSRGRLIELTLRRELAFAADVKSEKSGPMRLETGTASLLKVVASDKPPPQPVIIGGPKPPPPPETRQHMPTPPRRNYPIYHNPAQRQMQLGRPGRPVRPPPDPAATPTTQPGE